MAQTKTTKKANSKTQAPDPKPNQCVCGCGKKVRHLFAQGHDQRVRGLLMRNAADPKKHALPPTLAQAIRDGIIKHLQRISPNAKVLTAKAA